MAEPADDFARFADLFPEPLLLLSGSGRIHAANCSAVRRLLGGAPPVAEQSLADFVEESPDKIRDYLKMCSRSSRSLPGTLRFHVANSGSTGGAFHCEGSTFRQTRDGNRLVLLRLVPKALSVSRFVTLNQTIEQLRTEISLRVRAEETALERQEALRVTLASIGDAVITTATNGSVTFMNPMAETLTGWSSAEAVGRSLDEIFVIRNEETGEPGESPVRKVLESGRVVGLANHTVLLRKDGAVIAIDDSGAPIRDAADQLLGVVLVFHEIEERRRMERELARQAAALREADKRKDEFLAMLAHELRNPLAPLHNCVQLLRVRDRQPVNVDQVADMMERQTAQLTRLVDDLLDVSRITRGMIRLEKQPIALATVIEHAIETMQPYVEQRRHRWKLALPPSSLIVEADLARLSQVLCNLLTNAAKFMEPGGEITVIGREDKGRAVVSVRDAGAGLSADFLPYVFDLFTQGDRALDREHGGLGIGLTLVKTLVEMHGGHVSASSEGIGRGSEFVVSLPAMAVAERRPKSVKAPTETPLRRRVLIVDDNKDAADSLAWLLRAWGCEVRLAMTGEAAIQDVKLDMPDVILLDLGLPGMDGLDVARHVLRLGGAKRPTIVALTGYTSELDRKRSEEAGFDHHLAKPVDLEKLRKILD